MHVTSAWPKLDWPNDISRPCDLDAIRSLWLVDMALLEIALNRHIVRSRDEFAMSLVLLSDGCAESCVFYDAWGVVFGSHRDVFRVYK